MIEVPKGFWGVVVVTALNCTAGLLLYWIAQLFFAASVVDDLIGWIGVLIVIAIIPVCFIIPMKLLDHTRAIATVVATPFVGLLLPQIILGPF